MRIAACDNGGASYSCALGSYKTGSSCAGTGVTDSQTCAGESRARGACATSDLVRRARQQLRAMTSLWATVASRTRARPLRAASAARRRSAARPASRCRAQPRPPAADPALLARGAPARQPASVRLRLRAQHSASTHTRPLCVSEQPSRARRSASPTARCSFPTGSRTEAWPRSRATLAATSAARCLLRAAPARGAPRCRRVYVGPGRERSPLPLKRTARSDWLICVRQWRGGGR
jgi:hypothetical protein